MGGYEAITRRRREREGTSDNVALAVWRWWRQWRFFLERVSIGA